jgi:hypothetical protein
MGGGGGGGGGGLCGREKWLRRQGDAERCAEHTRRFSRALDNFLTVSTVFTVVESMAMLTAT